MRRSNDLRKLAVALSIVFFGLALVFFVIGRRAFAQDAGRGGGRGERVHLDPPVPTGPPINSAPNPYRTVADWYQWPQGRLKGSIPAVAVDQQDHIWAIERCGIQGFIAAACADSRLDPIFEFDKNGKILHNWGGGMFVFPHGIGIDADGNVWITDGHYGGKGNKGHQVFKFSPEGKVLMTLGKAWGGRGVITIPSTSRTRSPSRQMATFLLAKGTAATKATGS